MTFWFIHKPKKIMNNIYAMFWKSSERPSCMPKCSFFVEKVVYLGFIVSKDGLSPDPAKVEANVSWPIPRNDSEV